MWVAVGPQGIPIITTIQDKKPYCIKHFAFDGTNNDLIKRNWIRYKKRATPASRST